MTTTKRFRIFVRSNTLIDSFTIFAGVGFGTRQVGTRVTPVVELNQESDGRLTLSSKSTFKNVSITFKLGEEFEEVTPDGRKVKSCVTLEGTKLIQTQKNGKESTIIREFSDDEVNMVRKVQNKKN